MDHDTGFAPNIEYEICTLSGCKNNTIEKWATKDSWVIGIGGNNTCRSNKIIYAMEVDENLPYNQFKKKYPNKHEEYLRQMTEYKNKHGKRVLVSKKFYYFGNDAKDIPKSLEDILWNRCGCKLVSDEDINKLKKCLLEKYSYGKLGNPCNKTSEKEGEKNDFTSAKRNRCRNKI